MKETLQKKAGPVHRSNAANVSGKKQSSGISFPAQKSVVQRKIEVRPDGFNNHENFDSFKLATDIFLKSTKDPFLKKIKDAGSELELVIYAAEDEGKKGVTAGVTYGTVRIDNSHKGEEDHKDFNDLNDPQKVKWDKVNNKSPFRITIGINLHKNAHRKVEDMTATLLHEWHVHGTKWETRYLELLQSENPKDVFKDFDNNKVAMAEHKDYVEGKTGMDDALGDLTVMAERFAKGEGTDDEKQGEAYQYFHDKKSGARVRGIKKSVLDDIRKHENMTGEKMNREGWKNLNPVPKKKVVEEKQKKTSKRKKEDKKEDQKKKKKESHVVIDEKK